jgi:hypothetical protein
VTSLLYPACFLALAVLTGLVVASGRHWALRLPLLAATPLLAIAVWWQLAQRDGLPSDSHLADGSAFVAGVVQAPTLGDAGAIYLWVQPPNSTTPRAYRLPYSRQLEQQVGDAAKAAKRGGHVGVRGAQRPTHAKRRGGGDADVRTSNLRFYRLPSPAFEAKASPG